MIISENMTPEAINASDVVSVYSGKDGKCCCGCAGRYYYAKATRVAAGKARGYKVTDDEINDGMITRIVRLMNKTPEAIEWDDEYAALVVGGRLYMARFY